MMRISFKSLWTGWPLLPIIFLALSSAHGQTPPDKLGELEKHLQAAQKAMEELRQQLPPEGAPNLPERAVATNRPASATSARRTNDPISRIRVEGLEHSQVMQTLSYLTDVIGPRLTGSPNLKRANDWTRQKLEGWGLTNAQLEAWGPFGRGWSLKRFSAQVVEPQTIPLLGYPKAWSPGLDEPLLAEVIHLDGKTEADLEKYKGKLKGAIVLAGPVREIKAHFEPLGSRMAETNLLRLANVGEQPSASRQFNFGGNGNRGRFGGGSGRRFGSSTNSDDEAASNTNATPSTPAPGNRGGPGTRPTVQPRFLSFLAREGAALAISPSLQGDGGTFFVAAASVPGFEGARGPTSSTNGPRVWSMNPPKMPPQLTLAAEDYNRLVRMIQQGEKLKMAVDLQVQFHEDDLMAYNTVAELPGSDLKDQIVMLGAHIDSWQSGTGATDNGAGVAATMEAMRILAALKLQPRRTIRIGLWSGEEQGLLGSKAYVSSHFGFYTNATSSLSSSNSNNSRPRRNLVRQAEYEQLSAYFNLDNGTGKIRGVYMQGNEAVRPLFRRWLQPFADLEAETLTLSNTGGTDHGSFDAIGLPGFQFIQDQIEYNSRTHHSNADVFDRIQAEDLKQAATILAAFAYNAAMLDEKLPRKALE